MTEGKDNAPHRLRNRWGEGDRLRVDILRAASTLLSELGGEDGLSVRGIARAVGISAPSIYGHFADRAALIAGLREYESARVVAELQRADESVDHGDVAGRARAQVHAYADFIATNPGHFRLLSSRAHPARGLHEYQHGPLGQLTAAFARCVDAGHTLRLPSDRAAVMVFVSAQGLAVVIDSYSIPEVQQRVRTFVDEVLGLIFV